MQISKDLREFIELLNSNGVDYLIVGGFAVAWHGHPRFTGDIDLLIRATGENARRVIKTLADFGFASLEIGESDLSRPNQIVQLGVPPNRIDLITSISGVEFSEAWERRVGGTIDGIPVQFIGLEELIRNKESTDRGKDRLDAEELRKRSSR